MSVAHVALDNILSEWWLLRKQGWILWLIPERAVCEDVYNQLSSFQLMKQCKDGLPTFTASIQLMQGEHLLFHRDIT